jgi:pyruvate dehydrogenase E2 component (dihydrolipoamide acetyltransferase)
MLLGCYRKRLQSLNGAHYVALEIAMPRLSDSMEEGTILRWFVREGDSVDEGQPLAEVETDKATVVYEAQSGGVVLALRAAEGTTVAVGTPIAVLGAADEEMAPAPVAGARRAKASPLARRIAVDRGIDLLAVAGTGPEGRIIKADLDRHTPRPEAAPLTAEPLTAEALTAEARGASPEPADGAKGPATHHELTRLQQTVARRMSESRATVPDIELRSEVDAGELVDLRERLREVSDPVPSLNDFIVRAAAMALRAFPRVNGAYRDGGLETYARVNVGIAVAADDALVVPTICDADTKSVADIAQEARALAARVRDGSITPAELSGGTFTVSNLGMYGVDSFSAVINPPQAAILAVGALRLRPVAQQDSGRIVARPTIQLTLACDHRIVYGVDGARYLTRVRELLERPLSLLL